MIDPAKLRNIRQGSSIPTWEVLRRLDLQNLNYLFKIERGEHEPAYETIRRFAEAFEVSPGSLIRDDVLSELSQNNNPGVAEAREGYFADQCRFPVVGYVSAGEASVPEYLDGDMPPGQGVLGNVHLGAIAGADAYAVQIQGDSMVPRFRDGNILIVSPSAEWGHNDICLVRHTDGRVWVKRLMRYEETWCLEPDNPFYESIPLRRNEINYIHRVIVAVLR